MAIVRSTYRYKPPPRKRKAVPLAGPAVVTPKRKQAVPLTVEPIPSRQAIVRKTKPCNDNRPDVLPQDKPAAIVLTAKPSRATHKTPEDNPGPTIVTARPKRRGEDGPLLPMELPLSRQPVERDGGNYKRLRAAI